MKTYRRPTNPTSILADQNARAIATELLSNRRQEKSGDTIRFLKDKRDNHPSLVVVVNGRDCGIWYEHREGGYHDDSQCAGGRMVSFVMRFGSMDREPAHQWIRERFANQKVNLFNFQYEPTADELNEAEKKQKRFVNLLKQSSAIKGTISEQYLRDERNITPANDFPTSLRHSTYNRQDENGNWHQYPALLGLALNAEGDVYCVHLVPLNNDGKKTGKTEFRTYKPGAAKGTAVILRKPISGVLVIAEGLETALSVWSVVPEVGVMAVGSKENLKFAPIPPNVKILVFAQDNDRDSDDGGKRSEHTYKIAAEHFNKSLSSATVIPLDDGEDWNDVLQRDPNEVRDAFLSMLCLFIMD